MKLAAAYLVVVIIWSTTPLGIVWSSETVTPTLAVLLRMLIAWVIGFACLLVFRISIKWQKQEQLFYLYSTIGVAGGMFLSYMAARSVPSGMLSLVFGFSPIFSGLFGQWILKEKPFSFVKKCALFIAFGGLFVVCYDKLFASANVADTAYIDLLFLVASVILFSLSGVLVKTLDVSMSPLSSTLGTLTFSMPLFVLFWLLIDGDISNSQFEIRSVLSIIYLGIFGSLFGFIAYFYVLKRLPASTVSLVTLLTPGLAILLGNQLNNESVSTNLIVGTALVICGLALFFFGDRLYQSIKRQASIKVGL